MHRNTYISTIVAVFISMIGLETAALEQESDMRTRVAAALPDKPFAKPKTPRRLLVFNLCRGYPHSSIPIGAHAIELLGEKTGAFTATASDDIAMFEPDKLRSFDAVLFNNTTGELFLPE